MKNKKSSFFIKKMASQILVYTLMVLMISPYPLFAAPQGPHVVAGQVHISQQVAATLIHQFSDKAIINWKGFNISASELVKFLQPGSQSIALNRITGGNPTEILGQLSANGRVFILNPNGVVFGSSARIDVAGLLASTMNIKDKDFLNGNYNFTQGNGNSNAFVVNQGKIKVGKGGFAFLVAPGVRNEGLIVARLGQVVLASGNKMSIDFHGDGLVSYAISGNVANKITGLDGKQLDASVSNSGTINAAGGNVLMQGASVGSVFSSVVNNDGVIMAQSLQKRNGKIILMGGAGGGIVSNAGTLDVSAAEPNTSGGNVALTGHFTGNSGVIAAQGSGAGHGGQVSLNSTVHTITAAKGMIDVSGGNQGNGGVVKLRSGNRVTFAGKVKARGGSLAGNGGFVDVSSPGQVDIFGKVDASAPSGKTGTLLIDPKNIEIKNTGGTVFSAASNVFTATPAGSTVITATSLNTQTANVVLQANTDITVTDIVNIANAATGLTLLAGRSILINNNITTNNGNITMTANDHLAVAANRTAGMANITMAAGTTVNAGSGNIVMSVDATTPVTAGGIQVDKITTTGNLTMSSVGSIVESVADNTVDLRANVMKLTTTGSGSTIGSPGTSATDPIEIHAGSRLDITTNNGAVAIHSIGSSNGGLPNFFGTALVNNPVTTNINESKLVDLNLGIINVGTSTLIATVTDGRFLDATAVGAPNITAGNANLVTDGGNNVLSGSSIIGNNGIRGGSIGTATRSLRTKIANLSASTTNGGIYVNESSGVILGTILARQENVAAHANGSTVVVSSLDGRSLTGANSVSITAAGDMVVNTVNATKNVMLTSSGGMLIDGNQASNNITAKQVTLAAATGIGQSANAIDNTVERLTATATNGGVFISMGIPGIVNSVTAGGTGNNASITAAQGLTLGLVTANGGAVTIDAGNGTITDGNGITANIVSASTSLTAKNGIGSSADSLETTVDSITVDVKGISKSFFITESNGLNAINATVNRGDTNLTFSGGIFSFNATSGLFRSSGVKNVTFDNTGGNVVIGTVNATTLGTINITALGAITDSTSALTANTATLTAGMNIGATAGGAINTTVNTLIADASLGSVFIQEANGMTVSATAAGLGQRVDIATTTGNLTVANIAASGAVTLTAAGSILAASSSESLSGSSAVLTAGGAIGAAGSTLSTTVSTLSATANGGGLFLSNTGDLTLTTATATGAALNLSNSGALIVNSIADLNNTATISSSGNMTDGNGASLNIQASTLVLSGASIGSFVTNGAIDIDVSTLTASTTAGGIFVNQPGTGALHLLSATAVGSNADANISTGGNIALGLISAKGDNVVLNAGGAITDANGASVNVVANIMNITAPGGIGTTADPLEVNVRQISSTGNAYITNSGPLAITEAALQGGTSSFIADTITILNIADNVATLPNNVSLTLRTATGNIIFLDTNDTIVASGTGTVTIDAGTANGSGAVAIIGNITTANQNILINADSHISIGLLNAGTGDVTVASAHGSVLDGNGAANNIIARNFSLSGITPSARALQIHTITAIAQAQARASEMAAKLTTLDTNIAANGILTTSVITQTSVAFAAITAKAIATAVRDQQASITASLSGKIDVLQGVVTGLGAAVAIADAVAAVADAIPFSGDGGTSIVANALKIGLAVADVALFALNLKLTTENNTLGTLNGNLDARTAENFAANNDLLLATVTLNASNEATSMSQAVFDTSVIASDAASRVSSQAIMAENVASTAGTASLPFGIKASGTITINAQNSDVAIQATGLTTKIGNITASKATTTNDAFISIQAAHDITLTGNLVADDFMSLQTPGAIVSGSGSNLTAAKLVAVAGTGVGNSGALNTNVDVFAANGGTSGVALVNGKALTIGTVNGVSGITAAGIVNVSAASPLTVSQNVTSTGGAITLTAGNSAASGDDLTIGAVTISSNAGVSLTAGDNVSLVFGGAINGTAIAITADKVGDGSTDGVTGSITLAGDITGSSIHIAGGGLNQTGTITSTGLVNIAANSAITSAIQGISLAAIQAGGTIDVISSNALTLTKSVITTSGAITLTAGNSAASGDDLTIGAVSIRSSNAGVNLTAGDNISLASGGTINGTAIAITADKVGDGNADGVTGSITLAGDITGSSVNIAGGGLNQTGTITSTGLVNITANSASTSAIQGISLAAIQAGGTIDVISSNALALTKNVITTGGAITLTARNSTASVDDLSIGTVTVSSNAGVNLTAGDNISLAFGGAINGTAIAITADKVGDGNVDGVTGSITLAGDITGSSIHIAGGGLNQTGTITSTGLVNIAAHSTSTSAIQGISLAAIQAGGTIDVISSNALALTKNVITTIGAITLTAGNSAASGDDLTIGAVIVGSNPAGTAGVVNLTAGDNVSLAFGGAINGTAIAITANNDGSTDGVTGSITLAGDITGSSVNIAGGGLNQTGTITSTGLVNIAANSAITSAIQGISLAAIQAGGTIDVISSNALTLTKNVITTGIVSAITLTAGNSAASGDDLTIGAVSVSSNAGVNLTAGDNISLAFGGAVNGTAIAITANNDGNADSVTGSITLAGDVTGSSVTIAGGGLNQTGTITSTGLVNIAAHSTSTSAIQGISLAAIQAGSTIDVISSKALALTKNVITTSGAITLTAGNSAASGDDLTIGAVSIRSSNAGVNLTAGDNISLASGGTINGTAIAITADKVGDGNADGVTGSITLAGDVSGSSIHIAGGGLNQTGTITSTGLVNITANSASTSAIQGISLAAIQAGGAIDVISSNALALTGNVITTIGAITLTAGNSAASGDDLTIGAVSVSSNAGVNLTAGDNISLAFGGAVNGTAIAITADNDGNADSVTGSITLAGDITGSSVNIAGGGLNQTGTITSTGLVNITANSAITSAIQGISLAAIQAGGAIDVISSNALALTGNVITTGGAITLTARNSTASVDDLSIGAVQVSSNAGVSLTAGDNISLASGGAINGTAIGITADKVGDGSTDGVTGSITLAGDITGSSIHIAGGGLNQTGTITSTGRVDVAVNSNATSAIDGIMLGSIQAAGQPVNLSASGTTMARILDNNGSALNVRAGNLAMVATAGIGTVTDALEIEVSRLAANGGTGGIALTNTGSLILGRVDAVNKFTATGGVIGLSTTGNLAISNGFVQGAGLNVALLATGGSITEINPGVAADIVAANLNLTVTGAGNTIGTAAQRLELDAGVLNAATEGGSIYLEDTSGGVAAGLVTTTGAVGSVVDLLVTGGSLTASGTMPNIVGETLNLVATGGSSTIGTANQFLGVDAVTLKNVTTQGGDIYITDTNGGVAVNLISTTGKAGSKIALTSLGGNITEALPVNSSLVFNADIVTLRVSAPNSNIGSASQPLNIGGSQVHLNNTSGQRTFINFPNGIPLVRESGRSPATLLVANGKVIGGGNIAIFAEAQSTLVSSANTAIARHSLLNLSFNSPGQPLMNSNLVTFEAGLWGAQ